MSILISVCSPMSIHFLHSLLVNLCLFSSISPYLYFNSLLFLLVNICLLLSIIINVCSFSSFSSRSCLLSSRRSIHSHLTAITKCPSIHLSLLATLCLFILLCLLTKYLLILICPPSSMSVHSFVSSCHYISIVSSCGVCPLPSELTIILFDSNDKYSISYLISFFFTQIRPASFENQLSKYYF